MSTQILLKLTRWKLPGGRTGEQAPLIIISLCTIRWDRHLLRNGRHAFMKVAFQGEMQLLLCIRFCTQTNLPLDTI
jgi:hypothetical protein